MLKQTVEKFAREQVQPKVAEMDEKEQLDPSILKGLFEQGVYLNINATVNGN